MSVFKPELARYLERAVDDITGDEDGGPITHFDLHHSNEGGIGLELLRRFPSAVEPDNIADIAQEIWDVAEEDAKSRVSGMPERYVVLAYRGEDSREHVSQYPFVLADRGVHSFADTNSPTPQGHMGQQMRFAETLHKTLMQQTEIMTGKLMQDNRELAKRCERAEGMQLELMELHQKLLDRSTERQLEMAEAVNAAKRKDEMTSFAMGLLPLLAAKLFSGSAPIAAMGGGSTAGLRDGAVGKFLKNLSEEEAMKVFGALKPENQAVLFELYKTYQEDDAKEQQAKPEILRDKPEQAEEKTETLQ